MSLIKCPECAREISDNAEYCIHCGYPIKKQNSVGRASSLIPTSKQALDLSLAIIFPLLSFIIYLPNKPKKSPDALKIVTFYIRYNGSFSLFKEFFVPADSVSEFSIGLLMHVVNFM